MKNIFKLRDMSLFRTIGLVITLGASITAYSQKSWKEEVLPHDGQKIIATRTVERGGNSEIGQQAPIKKQSVAFLLPTTNEKVVWEDKFTEDIGGANFYPCNLKCTRVWPTRWHTQWVACHTTNGTGRTLLTLSSNTKVKHGSRCRCKNCQRY